MTQTPAPAPAGRYTAVLGKKKIDFSALTADYVSEYGYEFPYFYVAARGAGDITYVDALGNLNNETFVNHALANAGNPDRRPLLPLLCKRVVILDEFNDTAALRVSGGSGTGAMVESVTVNSSGQITAIEWESGSLDYETGDILTLFQDYQIATYTVLAADVTPTGRLRNLSGKTIASTTDATDVNFAAIYGP